MTSGIVKPLLPVPGSPSSFGRAGNVLLPFACELRLPFCASDWTGHPFALFAWTALQPVLNAVRPPLPVRMASV